jgi:hypothetical protein
MPPVGEARVRGRRTPRRCLYSVKPGAQATAPRLRLCDLLLCRGNGATPSRWAAPTDSPPSGSACPSCGPAARACWASIRRDSTGVRELARRTPSGSAANLGGPVCARFALTCAVGARRAVRHASAGRARPVALIPGDSTPYPVVLSKVAFSCRPGDPLGPARRRRPLRGAWTLAAGATSPLTAIRSASEHGSSWPGVRRPLRR